MKRVRIIEAVHSPVRYRPFFGEARRLVVWWYGAIQRSYRNRSTPYVEVYLRELDSQDRVGNVTQRKVPIDVLGVLRLGSVWKSSKHIGDIDLVEGLADLSFSSEDWSQVSSDSVTLIRQTDPTSTEVASPCPLAGSGDWLIEFLLEDDLRVLVPCLEFFTRAYGRSAEVRRIISSFPWPEVDQRCFEPLDRDANEWTWPIKLMPRIQNVDTVFMAHMKYDQHTQSCVKSIYAQLESELGGTARSTHLKVAPWFDGRARLKLKGRWLSDQRTFLALRIDGMSEPSGAVIERSRTRIATADEVLGEPDAEGQQRVVRWLPEILDLTDEGAPTTGHQQGRMPETDFEVIGRRRVIVNIDSPHTRSRTRTVQGEAAHNGFAPGEAGTNGTGTGLASLHSAEAAESYGVLRDMWNAQHQLRQVLPSRITSVEVYTGAQSFSNQPEPVLVPFASIVDEDDAPYDMRSWPYLDPRTRLFRRGLLFTRMRVDGQSVHVVEIQRRQRLINQESGPVIEAEEHFEMLAFSHGEPLNYSEWLPTLMNHLVHSKGVMRRARGLCPGVFCSVPHQPAQWELFPCHAALTNALTQLGFSNLRRLSPQPN